MIVKVLSENTTSSDKLGSEHGLSLYIETGTHKILFDTGASGLFAENAEKMGVDLTKVDLAVISHGHYDHGGGLKTFLCVNSQAKVYLHKKAFEPHYANRPGGVKAYIGLDESLLPNERFVFCGDHFVIDHELELFSGIESKRLVPSGNLDLFMKDGTAFVQDNFAHEQNLIISENGKTLLIAGCAHNGIINIIDQFNVEKGYLPDYVIGGFHLYNHGTKQNEAPNVVDEIGNILLETHSQYYTCHCTGIESYNRLKTVMGENIDYISTGEQLTIGLYSGKSIRAIGRLVKVIVASRENGELTHKADFGEPPTDEEIHRINSAIERAKAYDYNLSDNLHKYFIVDKFYEMDFRKASKNPIQKSKYFNLAEMLGYVKMPSTEQIAHDLDGKTWEEF